MIAVADFLQQTGWCRPMEAGPGELRQVVLIHGADDYWVAECPSLPGCVSEGSTLQAAIANVRTAIADHLDTLRRDGRPAPPERYDTLVLALAV